MTSKPRELGRWEGRRLCMESRTRSVPRQALSFPSVAARFLFSYDKSKQQVGSAMWRTLRLFSAPQARQRARLHTGRDSLRCGVDRGITQKIRFQEACRYKASSEDSESARSTRPRSPSSQSAIRRASTRPRQDLPLHRAAEQRYAQGLEEGPWLRLGRRPTPGGAQRSRTSTQKGNRAWTWDSRTRPHG